MFSMRPQAPSGPVMSRPSWVVGDSIGHIGLVAVQRAVVLPSALPAAPSIGPPLRPVARPGPYVALAPLVYPPPIFGWPCDLYPAAVPSPDVPPLESRYDSALPLPQRICLLWASWAYPRPTPSADLLALSTLCMALC